MASSSPASFSSAWSLNLWAWSSGSLSSEKPLAISLPPINSSKRSVTNGFSSLRLARGETSVGYWVIKVGWINFFSTVFSKISILLYPIIPTTSIKILSIFNIYERYFWKEIITLMNMTNNSNYYNCFIVSSYFFSIFFMKSINILIIGLCFIGLFSPL